MPKDEYVLGLSPEVGCLEYSHSLLVLGCALSLQVLNAHTYSQLIPQHRILTRTHAMALLGGPSVDVRTTRIGVGVLVEWRLSAKVWSWKWLEISSQSPFLSHP